MPKRTEDGPTYSRTTISVPTALQARMRSVPVNVNWSAVACRAFRELVEGIEGAKSNGGSVRFMDLCSLGIVAPFRIDDFVDQWHGGTSDVSLAEFLGMTESEYEAWGERPTALAGLIEARRNVNTKRP